MDLLTCLLISFCLSPVVSFFTICLMELYSATEKYRRRMWRAIAKRLRGGKSSNPKQGLTLPENARKECRKFPEGGFPWS